MNIKNNIYKNINKLNEELSRMKIYNFVSFCESFLQILIDLF